MVTGEEWKSLSLGGRRISDLTAPILEPKGLNRSLNRLFFALDKDLKDPEYLRIVILSEGRRARLPGS